MKRHVLLGIVVLILFITSDSRTFQQAGGDDDQKTRVGSATDLINTMIADKWKERNITPAPPSDDAEFLRRITLDLAGTVPSADEVIAFIKGKDAQKRQKKIDELIASDGFVEHWTDYWSAKLLGRKLKGQYREGKEAFETWLSKSIESNKPYNQLVTELLAAEGRNDENGAANYMLIQLALGDRSPEFIAGNVTRTFLGVRVQCAQCHNHPYEKWTREDFYGMTAFFTRVGARPIREDMMDDAKDKGDDKKKKVQQAPKYFELMERRIGEARIPGQVKAIPPLFLTGEKLDDSKRANRREEFAKLMTKPQNPYFARAIVNRMWSIFMGRGIVDPIDDFRESNPPTHPELLDALAKDFVAHGYDMKYLIRSIVASRPYQLSSKFPKGTEDSRAFFAQASLKSLSPEQLFYAFMQVSGVEDIIKKRARGQYAQAKERMIQGIAFLFENDEMEETTDFEGTISQALLLMNGQLTTEGTRVSAENRLSGIIKKTKNPGERIEWIFLTVLSRPPSDAEKARYLEYVKVSKGADAAYQDLYWVLLNSTEFIFNH